MVKGNMNEFIETIRLTNGIPQNIEWNKMRIERTIGQSNSRNICMAIESLEGDFISPIQRATIKYNEKEIIDIRVIDYHRPCFSSYKLFDIGDTFTYNYKYADRSLFDSILNACNKNECPILVRNGQITDTHFSNIIVLNQGYFITPRIPLLKGTARERLLFNGMILEQDISYDDLAKADAIHLINAMNDINDIVINPLLR